MNRIEPIGPTPVSPVKKEVERREDEAPPQRDQQREQQEQAEPEDENGLDVRV